MDWRKRTRDGRTSHYALLLPLYCASWAQAPHGELAALLLFREGAHNRLSVVVGTPYDELGEPALEWTLAADTAVDYPVTAVQWDPALGKGGWGERLAALLEVLRLYAVDRDGERLVQTHVLANNLAHDSSEPYDISTFPPVTAFDWNRTDPTVVITLLVDTTCTVWDLHRAEEAASVKTQLIAHDLEVYDVKFLHASTNVFALVSNDGLMRVFDLRLLEHLTIIYEPASSAPYAHYNPQALLHLLTLNVDQHHLATVGVHLNQVLVIDMRMPGTPAVTLDALFGGKSPCAVNALAWHPHLNLLLTGGDDCQALVWDCTTHDATLVDTPVLAYADDLEVNYVCWRPAGDWMGVVSGKGFQALPTHY